MEGYLWNAVWAGDYEHCCKLANLSSEETDKYLYLIGKAEYMVRDMHNKSLKNIKVASLAIYNHLMTTYLKSGLLDVPPLQRYKVELQLSVKL